MRSTNATEYCFINFTLQSLYLSMCLIPCCSTFVFKCYSTFHSCVSSLIKASTSLRHTCWRNFETQSKSVGKKKQDLLSFDWSCYCERIFIHSAGLRTKVAKHYKNHIQGSPPPKKKKKKKQKKTYFFGKTFPNMGGWGG